MDIKLNDKRMERIHLIAIGGAAMHNLALALKSKGYNVTGSDDEIFDPSYTRLKDAGLLPKKMGWDIDNIQPNIDTVILGMHARKDNPELLQAQKLGLNVVSYPEYLYEQTRGKKRVVIAGSHGKTSVTAMVMHVLMHNGIKFDYMVGSQLEGFNTMVSLSQDTDIAVFEGDEYLSSPIDLRPKFLHYKPHIAVINGIAWDHINVFPTFEGYVKQFSLLIEDIHKEGTLIYFNNDKVLNGVVADANSNKLEKIPFEAVKHCENGVKTFLIDSKNAKYETELFGQHNMQNISAAYEVCKKLGISEKDFFTSISRFKGTKKRLEKVADSESSIVYIDFAHSPSKVKATLASVKSHFTEKRVIACLELHTFSSLNKSFLLEYAQTLDAADEALVFYNPEVVKHKKLDMFSADDVLSAFSRKDLKVFNERKELEQYLISLSQPNTIWLFMSSGNYNGIDFKTFSYKLLK
ncbi:MAG: Mur ligase domain-containing protein [Bacteroidales bacterium]|nr:Mur ligase domain-containing protein [Bacteroidales bacterium]